MKNVCNFLFAIVFIVNSVLANSNKRESSSELKAKAQQFITEKKQLGFQENKGQMLDTDNKPAPNVLFKAEIPNLTIWITTSGLTYQFFKTVEDEGKKGAKADETETNVEWHRVDMILKGASIKKKILLLKVILHKAT